MNTKRKSYEPSFFDNMQVFIYRIVFCLQSNIFCNKMEWKVKVEGKRKKKKKNNNMKRFVRVLKERKKKEILP